MLSAALFAIVASEPADFSHLGSPIQNGVDGWEMVDFDWDPETGFGRFEYERVTRAGLVEQYVCVRPQPTDPRHAGWRS